MKKMTLAKGILLFVFVAVLAVGANVVVLAADNVPVGGLIVNGVVNERTISDTERRGLFEYDTDMAGVRSNETQVFYVNVGATMSVRGPVGNTGQSGVVTIDLWWDSTASQAGTLGGIRDNLYDSAVAAGAEPGLPTLAGALTFTQEGIFKVRHFEHFDARAYVFFLVVGDATFPVPPIVVTINGQRVNFADQAPVAVDGRTLVPVRGVFEMLGFDVDWDNATNTAIISSVDYEMRITIGSNVFTVNGTEHNLDVPAQSIGGRTMVPIRLPLESVGKEVDWNGATSTVIITVPIIIPDGGEMGRPGDPSVEELRAQLRAIGVNYDDAIDGRPVFILTATERSSVIDFVGYAVSDRFDFFGTLGYMRDIDGRTVFLVYALMD